MVSSRQSKATVPENIAEEYYQISHEILSSFPKYRPPVDLFQFREDILKLYPYSRKGCRLTNEQIEEIQILCNEGRLFVSRTDHPIYSEHIVKQVDLVLLDSNLKEAEAADIFIRALDMRLLDFIGQPVLPVFEKLYNDLMVFTEFLWQDKHRIKLFMRRLYTEHTLSHHSLNTLFIGLWLLQTTHEDKLIQREWDRSALGLILHDIGMSKIPSFILEKATPLKSEEKEKILLHTLAGVKILQKLNLGFNEITQAVMEHQERLDGSGYPNKLKETHLSKFGKLCAVADSFAAMISNRPYAQAIPPKAAAQLLANDKERYDSTFTVPLLNAYLTGALESKLRQEHSNNA
ncbi:HD family phosphohydrolase [Lawsonia intracellularis]|uniref:HD-GYP domain-containing protein n=1 Tax=Lawsonia intracellularis TaxID=29546 RepID=UPI000978C9E9|nr:HD domain-containing phosphohydrolase [Lawsonia intracellularis]OMQ02336.1 HD family phosphohydrolase [Lawsonia intracellularis]